MTITEVRYYGKNAWSEAEDIFTEINNYLNDGERYRSEELLWLLYRDKLSDCEDFILTSEFDNILIQDLLSAIQTNDENIRDEILKIIKYLYEAEAEETAMILNMTKLRYRKSWRMKHDIDEEKDK